MERFDIYAGPVSGSDKVPGPETQKARVPGLVPAPGSATTGRARGRAPVVVLCATALLAGCGSTSTGNGSADGNGYSGPKPVSLVKSFGSGEGAVQTVALNPSSIAKAVERYRINKKADPSPYRKVGVDLNGDGQAEALVYLTGEKWCAKTGCTLTVFRSGQYGYRAVSTIRRVKLPIRIASGESQGWRNLVVNTGGVAGLPMQTVLLQFTGRGYPGNATTIAPIPQGVPIGGTVVLDAPPAVTQSPGNSGQSNAAGSPRSAPPQPPLSLNP